MKPQNPATTIATNDATTVVLDWLDRHPDLAASIKKGADRPGLPDNVLTLLYPYDRFPETLRLLILLSLARVDWDAVYQRIGADPT